MISIDNRSTNIQFLMAFGKEIFRILFFPSYIITLFLDNISVDDIVRLSAKGL